MKKTALSLIILSSVFAVEAFAQVRRTPANTNNNAPVARRPAAATYNTTSSWSGRREVQIGANGTGTITNQKASTPGASTVTTIQARGSYAVILQPQIQVGGEANFFNTSGGTSATYLDFAGFATYNFRQTLEGSPYAKGGIGMFAQPKVGGEYESKVGFFVGGGMRFPLIGTLSYNPEARIYKKGDMDPSIEIMIINASLMF